MQVDTYGYSHDANGNMTSRAGSTITWFSNNYPAAIAASDATGSEEVQFTYGPDRQRWKQVYTLTGSPTETTYYVGGLIDLVFLSSTTNYRQYIYAGSKPIAVYSRTAAGVNTMSYIFQDHQGSVSAIANSAGTADIHESFTAFGQRRNTSTWSGPPATGDLNTIATLSRQGYTFQTALGQSMGLNHMNGRVEDAILGRFLSPDPYTPDPTSAQDYNRYSYVDNNPLTLIDPTGFDDCADADGLCEINITATLLLDGLEVVAGSTIEPGPNPGEVIITAPDGTQTIVGLGKPGKPAQPKSVNSAPQAPTTTIAPTAQSTAGCPNAATTIALPAPNPLILTPMLTGLLEAAVYLAPLVIPGDTVQQPPQYVVRGGLATPANLVRGATQLAPPYSNLTGFSVTSAPNMSVNQLAIVGDYPNGQISYTTTANLLGVGVTVVPTPSGNNPLHSTALAPAPLPPAEAAAISAVFRQMPNPALCAGH